MSSASLISFCNYFFTPNPHFLYFHGRVGLCNWNSSAVSLMKNVLCLKGIFCFALWYIKIWSLFFILYLKGTETYLLIWSEMWVTSLCEIKFKFIWALVLPGLADSFSVQWITGVYTEMNERWQIQHTTPEKKFQTFTQFVTSWCHKLTLRKQLTSQDTVSLVFCSLYLKKKKPSSKVFKSSISILAYTNPQRVKTE